ncbi:hypothetical protein [Streptomyces sp. TR06-5]|uniref:hypothetical protein n=1 Tax=unclassified Streptomyces TaxID=2593676 RepID=UPI0039A0A49A
MPRPTPAQLAYGTLTVVPTALALLVLWPTRSAPGLASIAVVALAFGLVAAVKAAPYPPGSSTHRTTSHVHAPAARYDRTSGANRKAALHGPTPSARQ